MVTKLFHIVGYQVGSVKFRPKKLNLNQIEMFLPNGLGLGELVLCDHDFNMAFESYTSHFKSCTYQFYNIPELSCKTAFLCLRHFASSSRACFFTRSIHPFLFLFIVHHRYSRIKKILYEKNIPEQDFFYYEIVVP